MLQTYEMNNRSMLSGCCFEGWWFRPVWSRSGHTFCPMPQAPWPAGWDMDIGVRPGWRPPAAIPTPIPFPHLRVLAARAAAFPAWPWQCRRRALHGAGALPIVPMPMPSPQSVADLPQEDSGMGALGDLMPPRPLRMHQPSMVVFSGGTAFNGVVEELKKFTTRVAHVLPVSDDGGSTAEIVRVLGGPAVGDIRSRCMRLSDEGSAEALAVRRLLGHRLPIDDIRAKAEWYEIVEGQHSLWEGVSGPYRETIRAFLVHFQSQILQRSYDRFLFSNGSIGNFFFAGARIFFGSLDAAIFLYSRVSQIPAESLVLPAICTNDRLTLGCELHDGSIIRGQNEISHPVVEKLAGELSHTVNKVMHASPPLPAPIKRIFYMSSEGTNLLHEVYPTVNATVLEQLSQVDAIIFGMGSFYTSVCPSLVLRGVGEAISRQMCPKVFILNGTYDRETKGMMASDFVVSLADALNRKYCDDQDNSLNHPPSTYVSVMLVPKDGEIALDLEMLAGIGVTNVVTVDSMRDDKVGVIYDPKALIAALREVIV